MPAEIEPPELASLLDLAERPRVADWSLRAALVRYGQPHPQRISQVLELVRRIDAAFRPQQKLFEKDGAAVWAAVVADAPPAGEHAQVIGLLRAAAVLDRLGDELAAWAVDPAAAPSGLEHEVDAAVADVTARLDDLDIPREERERPPRSRG
jgi:hypothetical protein